MNPLRQLLGTLALLACTASLAREGTFTIRSMTTETALAAASAALQSCRKQGYQVAVAVVDRAGLTHRNCRDTRSHRVLGTLRKPPCLGPARSI